MSIADEGGGGMSRCTAIKADGTRCERIVGPQQQYCFSHDPNKVADRKRVAATGGKAKHAKNRTVYEELHALAEWHKDLARLVREGRISRANAQTISNILNNAAGAYRASIKAKETEELEAQISELEDLFRREQQEDPVKPWGA